MSTTEVFVEQVLVGGLVLLAVGLMSPELMRALTSDQAGMAAALATGAVATGAAYLIGILADRVVDTMLQELERWTRLRYALTHGVKLHGLTDPFPEGRLRAHVMSQEGLAAHAGYLRSRMRLTRAVALLSPALSGAVIIGAVQSLAARRAAAAVLVLIYGLTFALRALAGSAREISGEAPSTRSEPVVHIWLRGVPGTKDGWPKLREYLEEEGLDRMRWDWVLLLGFVLVLLEQLAIARAAGLTPGYWLLVPSFGAVACIALWSWTRISWTFYRYLDDAWSVVSPR